MASGITLKMREFVKALAEREPLEWVQKERDRSLAGKKRIRARKAARR